MYGSTSTTDNLDDLLRVNNASIRRRNNMDTCILILGGVIIVLILVFIISLCFHGIEYNEYGYKRNILTQTIYWDKIYENGNWFWFLGFEPFIFPRHLLRIDLVDLSIIPDNGLEFYITATFFYRLNSSRIPDLFRNFGSTGYHDQIKKLAIGDIKHMAHVFQVEDYFKDRFLVEKAIEERLIKTLYENNVILDPGMFSLLEMKYPQRVITKYLQTGIQTQEKITAEFFQQQMLIDQETNLQVSLYMNNASFVSETTLAEMTKITNSAHSEAYKINELRKADGLAYFLDKIPVRNNSNVATIVKIMAYLKKHPQIFVGDHFNVFVSA